VTIEGGEWTLHSCGGRRFGFPPDLAGITFGRAFIDAARRAMRGASTPITQDVTINGGRVILTSVEVIATVPGPRVFALTWAPVLIEPLATRFAEGLARRAREAPLVALVAAVPEGLDANGWRAAVLAVAEARSIGDLSSVFVDGAMSEATKALSGSRDVGGGESRIYPMARLAVAAYRRAVAPQGPRPAPLRRKAPGLPIDMGEG
jgi:hypothetical protein